MIVDSYSIKSDRYNVMTGMTVNLVSESPTELLINKELVNRAFRNVSEIGFGSPMPVPVKIFRCGDVTTVIWKDGTKTIVKLMPGADDSDYGAFTAALAKKIYGGNGKVMKYAGMVQRVKSKAEKKATRKLKRKYEEKITGEKKYIVSQYGQVAECKGIETEEMGVGEKVIAYVESVEDAKRKAINDFKKSLNAYIVYSNGKAEPSNATVLVPFFGTWAESSLFDDAYFTIVFANSREEALKILEINPAPKEGDKP
jgi:hypothetical protein